MACLHLQYIIQIPPGVLEESRRYLLETYYMIDLETCGRAAMISI
jgi:hypothetical protein